VPVPAGPRDKDSMDSHFTALGGPSSRVDIGVGLGSNIGDRPANILRALALLEERDVLAITAVSPIYRTAPWGFVAQEPFANACALATTRLGPVSLLAALKSVETDMGRTESRRWGPRLIDIDILFYGDHELETPDLVLPHKEIFNRAFVLVPLAEIAPDLRLGGRSIAEAATHVNLDEISLWDGTPAGQSADRPETMTRSPRPGGANPKARP
jgi:2-amino-4-hydroxy-6-hydroxymethyldihydropteridine diphosphokinase